MSKYAPHGRSTNAARATNSTVCQKCLKTGHFIYECKSTRPYVTRPSRTQQLEKPGVLAKLKLDGKPSVEVPEEFTSKPGTANRILEAKEKEREKGKGKERPSKRAKRNSGSESDSDSSSGSDDSSSSSGSDSDSSGSESQASRDRARKRRVPSKRRSERSRSVSSASDSEPADDEPRRGGS
ncbi:hypothetical protein FIBSPDRAFT_847546 [Athelia psychrophila]|uniref:Zinc knuckle-domain-containing protein n=1 Tax=Athelia psychrophila TaxID=1759441 RepID=A0A166WCM8_9AGAM|nr:hypothetical protein FIBSPDRAFT_847546 [Fibularhizoctonia sp. CBS 109695]